MKKTLFVITPNGRRYRIHGFCYDGNEERDWTSVLDRKDGPNEILRHMENIYGKDGFSWLCLA